MKAKTIKLTQYERIIAVVPEHCIGPGWSNRPVWVYIADSRTKELREECLQPDEQTPEMLTLFSLGALMHHKLVSSVVVRNVKDRGTDAEEQHKS